MNGHYWRIGFNYKHSNKIMSKQNYVKESFNRDSSIDNNVVINTAKFLHGKICTFWLQWIVWYR